MTQDSTGRTYRVLVSSDPATDESSGRLTLAEVAALADVSVSTVSKVLNGRRGVSSQTRARIESLLADNEYSRRAAGSNPAPLIEVLCYEIDSAAGVKAKPFGWPSASLDPGSGRHPIAAIGCEVPQDQKQL